MIEEQLEEGQIVMCTVDKIMGTTVFVNIQDNGEGTITTSEIAPGRIRNLRTYVVPGKVIVCKILSIRGNSIHLSLRRVKLTEKKQLMDKINKEKSYKAILKTVLGDKAEEAIKKITLDYSLLDFFEKIKEAPEMPEKYLAKEDADKLLKILESKKEKPKELKQIIKLSSKSEDGIIKVKEIVSKACENSKCDVNYLAAGKYSLGILGENFKEIKTEINKVLDYLETQAKKQGCEFSIEKK
jgi:translation initiation factor 2 alpha subunit (eIF-2alpha)